MSIKSSLPPPEAIVGTQLNLPDIQGLVLRGYRHTYIRYFIFQIKDAKGAQEFCGKLQPASDAPLKITTAEDWGAAPPPYCLNVGVTSSGLKKLINSNNYENVAPPSTSSALFTPFDFGADYIDSTDSYCATYVGDTGSSDPGTWWKNGGWQLGNSPSPTSDNMDLLVCLYTLDCPTRKTFAATLLNMIPHVDGKPALVPAFIQDSDPLLDATGNPTNIIHFGYLDGLSQPRISGSPADEHAGKEDDQPFVPAWHFVINAPPLPSRNEPSPNYNAHPLLSNGCFGAFRLLYQDVEAFNAFIEQAGDDKDLLAAKMCGRWFDGTPLMVSPDKPDPDLSELDRTNFGYITPTANQKGPRPESNSELLCPYASHTRRTNPRDDTSVNGNSGSNANAVGQRIRRFARSYGPPYTSETSAAERGLVGLFMCADLHNQFEFIMSQWINQNGFSSADNSQNAGGIDPLFGPRDSTVGDYNVFEYPTEPTSDVAGAQPVYQSYTFQPPTGQTMARFLRTDGGLYVFLPSVTALGWLAKGELPSSS